ncbi:hypothetical protein HHX47_DHR6000663 [Lentinula edodes]|nr:hypothetical protein HHX47_DHR6000663 [Lentinula edodes]
MPRLTYTPSAQPVQEEVQYQIDSQRTPMYLFSYSKQVEHCLVYTRGSKQNIDKWASLTNDSSWGWDGMLPYFKKSEKFNLPVDGHNITNQFDPSFHGFDGYIGVSVPGAGRAIDNRVIQTTQDLPDEFPFTTDVNTGDQLGVGTLKTLTASKEVILSAGTIGTPSILLHSGIGNATTLTSLGITPRIHLPSVGQNLTDHIGVSSTWLVDSTLTYDTVLRNATLGETLLRQWEHSKTGINVDTSENHLAFLRLPENSNVLRTFGDPAAGNETAHFESQTFLFTERSESNNSFRELPEHPIRERIPKIMSVQGFKVHTSNPYSYNSIAGSVTINSTNPFDAPLIDPGLLSAEVDIHILREAIRTAHKFVEAAAWSDYILQDLTNATTDAEIDEFIRNNAVSFFHPVSTSAMSPFGTTDWGVVDPDLRVKGVNGLRIVDASVAPSLPAAHTSAAVYAIAEHAADIIKSAYGFL